MSWVGDWLHAGFDITQDPNDSLRAVNFNNIRFKQDAISYPVVPPDATVEAQAATANLVAADFGKNNTNTGASGTIVLTLPAASTVKGKCIRIQVTAAQIVSLSPAATEAVYLGGDGVVNKDLSIAGVIGNYVDVYCDGSNYLVTGYSGVATKEA